MKIYPHLLTLSNSWTFSPQSGQWRGFTCHPVHGRMFQGSPHTMIAVRRDIRLRTWRVSVHFSTELNYKDLALVTDYTTVMCKCCKRSCAFDDTYKQQRSITSPTQLNSTRRQSRRPPTYLNCTRISLQFIYSQCMTSASCCQNFTTFTKCRETMFCQQFIIH